MAGLDEIEAVSGEGARGGGPVADEEAISVNLSRCDAGCRRGFGRRENIHAENKSGHAGVFRSVGVRNWVVREVADHHMNGEVAVHDPVAGAFRSPSHVEGGSGKHFLGDDRRPLGRFVGREVVLIADAVHLKIKTVHVHCVIGVAGVDPAPIHGIADAQVEMLSVRPGFAIDGGQSVERRATGWQPSVDDEDAVVLASAGRIDDERGGEHGVSARAHEQRLAVVGTPVVVTAHGARLEMDFPHSAWGNFESARGIGSSSRIGRGRRRGGRRARAKTVNVNGVVQQVADGG